MGDFLFGTIVKQGMVSPGGFLAATIVSLLIGIFIAFMYSRVNHCSPSVLFTLIMVPAIVQLVIMMVNGNIGAGLAVAGAFSLVRFRSIAGKGQEITVIFLAMATGLATGMGYLGIAIIFAVIMMLLYTALSIVKIGQNGRERLLRITIPEDLDYDEVFDSIFKKYTKRSELLEARTTNMGSLYKLQYAVVLKNGAKEKKFLDEIRTRNGNLEVSIGKMLLRTEEL
ncbi:MAG: DUF4956 domain-containing protein [Lachnospiraceae bacterium]|nr:DUF4956 domain-containing protein [Lachnospiraceae bacterium]